MSSEENLLVVWMINTICFIPSANVILSDRTGIIVFTHLVSQLTCPGAHI